MNSENNDAPSCTLNQIENVKDVINVIKYL